MQTANQSPNIPLT